MAARRTFDLISGRMGHCQVFPTIRAPAERAPARHGASTSPARACSATARLAAVVGQAGQVDQVLDGQGGPGPAWVEADDEGRHGGPYRLRQRTRPGPTRPRSDPVRAMVPRYRTFWPRPMGQWPTSVTRGRCKAKEIRHDRGRSYRCLGDVDEPRRQPLPIRDEALLESVSGPLPPIGPVGRRHGLVIGTLARDSRSWSGQTCLTSSAGPRRTCTEPTRPGRHSPTSTCNIPMVPTPESACLATGW